MYLYMYILKNHKKILVTLIAFCLFLSKEVNAATLSILPAKEVIQGEPVMIQVSGANISDIKKITVGSAVLNIFSYKNKPTALYGVDLHKKVGNYDIVLTFKNGSTTKDILTVKERVKEEVAMAIPETSGGNSPANQTKFVNTMADDGAALLTIKTGLKSYWTKPFDYPVLNPIVTDTYGYLRDTGLYSITHKGTDFHATTGTKVFSMNRGIVRMTRKFSTYGNTVVVDHGLGVLTFYMHLSKIKVNVGELVQQGQLIGLSGSTGYATGPHLHITIRINNISIDPMKFLELFK